VAPASRSLACLSGPTKAGRARAAGRGFDLGTLPGLHAITRPGWHGPPGAGYRMGPGPPAPWTSRAGRSGAPITPS
jgi:hypothetical protein